MIGKASEATRHKAKDGERVRVSCEAASPLLTALARSLAQREIGKWSNNGADQTNSLSPSPEVKCNASDIAVRIISAAQSALLTHE